MNPTTSLGDLVGSRAVNGAVAELGMRFAWPILERARQGLYKRPGTVTFDVTAFQKAVLDATGRRVRSVRTRYQKNVFDVSDPEIRYGALVHFNDSLAIALYNANWEKTLKPQMISTYGRDKYDNVRDELWACIRREVCEPLGFQFWDDPEAMPISSSGESVATSLHYLLSAAMVGDEETVRRLDGIIRLLTKWIPIGEMKNEPGTWLAIASAV